MVRRPFFSGDVYEGDGFSFGGGHGRSFQVMRWREIDFGGTGILVYARQGAVRGVGAVEIGDVRSLLSAFADCDRLGRRPLQRQDTHGKLFSAAAIAPRLKSVALGGALRVARLISSSPSLQSRIGTLTGVNRNACASYCMRYCTTTLTSAGLVVQPAAAVWTPTVMAEPAE